MELGRMLYFETRLSRSQTISCNSCHQLDGYGVDHRPTSEGYLNQHGDRNSPTVYNAAAHFVQFWDGRAADVEAQARGPVLNPVEMAMASDKQVVRVLKSGCGTCHAGALLGGNLYQKLGNVKPYPDSTDPGRFKVTRQEADRMIFKVPSLRNVEKTGPYFHNGKVARLEDAVDQMAEYQLGKRLSPEEVVSITTYLHSLTGAIPARLIKPPVLPPSTAMTPKPEV